MIRIAASIRSPARRPASVFRADPARLGQELLGPGPHVHHRPMGLARTLAGIDEEHRRPCVGCRRLEERGHANGERRADTDQQPDPCRGRVDGSPAIARARRAPDGPDLDARRGRAGSARGTSATPRPIGGEIAQRRQLGDVARPDRTRVAAAEGRDATRQADPRAGQHDDQRSHPFDRGHQPPALAIHLKHYSTSPLTGRYQSSRGSRACPACCQHDERRAHTQRMRGDRPALGMRADDDAAIVAPTI